MSVVMLSYKRVAAEDNVLRLLSIQNVVLIERLDLEFQSGLCVLTGETGAGKSVLLDSLGLALGARADSGLVRSGTAQAMVTAEFDIPAQHRSLKLLQDNDLSIDGPLLLRRTVKADGGSRAFINDQPVSLTLLRDVGDMLLELHGQHDERGLLSSSGHRTLLDAFAKADPLRKSVGDLWQRWKQSRTALEDSLAQAEAAERDRDYLTHAVAELTKIAPEPGEEQQLAERRQLMMRGEKAMDDLQTVQDTLCGSDGALAQLRSAAKRLERIADVDAQLKSAMQSLDRAVQEVAETEDALGRAQSALQFNPQEQDQIETRLFELRAAARKYKVAVDDLPQHAATLAARLTLIEDGEAGRLRLQAEVAQTLSAYVSAAERLSEARRKAAILLDKQVAKEFAPLKLDKAQFRTTLISLPEADWGADGAEQVAFEISTNPGAAFGPLIKIASGGELSRFILALKVALAARGNALALIFDEIDRGVGGAVASAIGDRLAKLAQQTQLLVVTHSPQVAARGDAHFLIAKNSSKAATRTSVALLDAQGRQEEIARMLSGDTVTAEARAQANKLLAAA
jgi:DNA repair protein RecN (Recombination protein N)